MTLEEAQERIVELEENLATMTAERDGLKASGDEQAAQIERLRQQNQRYFERLSQQYEKPNPEPDPEPVPTCEEFAATLKI